MRLFLYLLLVGSAAAADLPHVILMMGDDHGWEETGYAGHPHVKTPVLDEMAAKGLRFDQFYSAHSSCSPTRASFLTGRHPNRMGTFAPGWSLRPEEHTIGHLMSAAGYHSAHLGKWHVGTVKAGSPTNPGAMGFHEWLSHDNFFELNPSLSRQGAAPEVFQGESSDILVTEAQACIRRALEKKKPVFLVIWFGSPHEPYSGLPEDLSLYDDVVSKYPKKIRLTSNETGKETSRPQGEVLRERYAEITAMDRAIGKLRTFLDEQKMRQNTLLFYCGDNGTSGESAVANTLRGVKGQIYEGGNRVPGLIEWPARIPEPRRTAFRATTSDLLPTLSALVKGTLPSRPLDGMDLSPVLSGELAERPTPLFSWAYPSQVLRSRKPKPYLEPEQQEGTTPLIKLSGGKATRDFLNFHQPPVTEGDYGGARSIIQGNMKLILQSQKDEKNKTELFDLLRDPKEQKNLAAEKPEELEKMRQKLRNWQESVLKSLSGADYAKQR